MRHSTFYRALLILLLLTGLAACATNAELHAPEVARIDADTVKARTAETGFHLIDARYDSDWGSSGELIAGAVREDPFEVSAWAPKYPKGDTLVIYCA